MTSKVVEKESTNISKTTTRKKLPQETKAVVKVEISEQKQKKFSIFTTQMDHNASGRTFQRKMLVNSIRYNSVFGC